VSPARICSGDVGGGWAGAGAVWARATAGREIQSSAHNTLNGLGIRSRYGVMYDALYNRRAVTL